MFTWILIIIIILYLVSKKKPVNIISVTENEREETVQKKILTEEKVFEIQRNFNEKLSQTYLPDRITGKDIFIFRNLMCVWFDKLSTENRYNDDKIQKIREDFLDYMYAVEHYHTSNYLAFEIEDEESRSEYDKEASIYANKIRSITGAFAYAVGVDAVKELERVMNLSYSAIDKDGNLAPEGMYFSLGGGGLKPITKEDKGE